MKAHRTIRTVLAIWLCGLLVQLPVSAQIFSTGSGHVEFESLVPLHAFTGKSDFLTGLVDSEGGTVDFFLDLGTLRTGNGKRDKDMRSTLNTDTFPFAEFFGRLTSSFDSELAGAQAVTIAGDFSIHGVTRSIVVHGTLELIGDELEADIRFSVMLADYDIEPPRLLIFKVDEEQKVHILTRLKME